MKPAVALVLLLPLLHGVLASPARALTLEEAFTRVLASHPRLRARSEEEKAARALVAAERAAGGPRAEVEADLLARQSRIGGEEAVLATRRQRLSLAIPLYDGGRAAARSEAAEAEARAARFERIAEARRLLAATVEAYAAVVRDRRLVELALSGERMLGEELAAAKRRYRLGSGTAAAVALAEARLALAAAERRRRIAQLAASGARLRALVGEEVADPAEPGLPRNLPAAPEEVSARLDRDPGLRAALDRLTAARARVRGERAAAGPVLSLLADLSLAGGADARSDTLADLAVGARLRMPLWDGGEARARARAARHRAEAAEAGAEARRRTLLEEAQALLVRLEAARARAEELERARRAARMLLEAARREVRAGTRAPVEVLDAVRELHEVEVARAENAYARTVSAWRLAILLGDLDHLLEGDGAGAAPAAHRQTVSEGHTSASPAGLPPEMAEADPEEAMVTGRPDGAAGIALAAGTSPVTPAAARTGGVVEPAAAAVEERPSRATASVTPRVGRIDSVVPAASAAVRSESPAAFEPAPSRVVVTAPPDRPEPAPSGEAVPPATVLSLDAAFAPGAGVEAGAVEPAAGPGADSAVVLHGRLTEMP